MQPATNPLQAQAAQSLLSAMTTFTLLRTNAQNLTSDLHRQQSATNSRLSDACRRLRELEEQTPARINPVVTRGETFRQPRTFASGLFLRHTAPEEVNTFRDRAQPQPDLRSLEQFRSFLSNPSDQFTISRPEYFLDCWLEEEESRQREYQRKQTKRRREEKKVVVPRVARRRMNQHGEKEIQMVGQEVVLQPSSLTPSLEEYSLEASSDSERFPPIPEHPSSSVSVVAVSPQQQSKGLPKVPRRPNLSVGLPQPNRTKPVMVPPPFVAPTTLPSTSTSVKATSAESVVYVQPSPLHQQIISSADIVSFTPSQPLSEVNVSAMGVSPEKTEASVRRSPLSFHEQITNGLGKAGLTHVKPEPRKQPKDYKPQMFKDIENRSQQRTRLKRVQNPVSQPQFEETNPLFIKLREMRDKMGLEATQLRPRESSAWSEMSSF